MATHPYHPSSLVLPDFVPIQLSPVRIASVFVAFFVVAFALCWNISGRYPRLSRADRLLVGWWAITGLVYIFLKGYWVFTPDFYKSQPSNLLTWFFNEFWKVYGKGDSRYPARFTTLVVIEGFTAVVEGPASLLAVYAIFYKKPYEHPLQFAASLTKLYGGIIYFQTAYLAETSFSVPGPMYFWGYFVAIKGSFVVIPFVIICRSWMYLIDAFASTNSPTRNALDKKNM